MFLARHGRKIYAADREADADRNGIFWILSEPHLILILLLLGLSNNGALRLLGVKWWKHLQRSAYLAFVLTVAHGLAF